MTEKTIEEKLEDAERDLTQLRTMTLLHMGMLYGMLSRMEKVVPFNYPETDGGRLRDFAVTVRHRAARDPEFRKACIEEGLEDYL